VIAPVWVRPWSWANWRANAIVSGFLIVSATGLRLHQYTRAVHPGSTPRFQWRGRHPPTRKRPALAAWLKDALASNSTCGVTRDSGVLQGHGIGSSPSAGALRSDASG
jgi:hypothetical protein